MSFQLSNTAEVITYSNEQQDSFFRAMQDSAQAFAARTLNGRILFLNQAFANLTGYSIEELRSSVDARALTPVEWHNKEDLVFKTLLKSGVPQEYEKEYLRRDGQRVPIRVKIHRFNTPEGEIGLFGFFDDISARKKAEKALRHQRRLYECILNNTPDLAYVINLDHRFIYANEVLLRMWGKSWDEAIGKSFYELGYEKWHADMHSREIEEVKATKKMIRGEVPFHGTFGRRIYEYIFVPVIGPSGEVEAIAGTTRDITERKEEDQKKDEFLATLAHELRNPLAPIRTGLEILKLGVPESSEKARHMMERQLSHLVRLVDDLMDISRVSRGKVELRFEKVELQKIVDIAIETSRPLFSERNHNLELAVSDCRCLLNADVTRLSQVLSNLLNNAAKYTPEHGKISLSAYTENGHALFKVEDNGAGIPEEMLTKVFNLFTQVGKTIDRAQGGLGIGLSLVKRLVEMHGGSVWAESPGIGRGSTFTVKVPLLLDEGQYDIKCEASHKTASVKAKIRRILVVDDNIDAAESLSMMLQLAGHELKTAHSAEEAFRILRDFDPDVAFLDIGLPDINGYEIAQEVSKDPRYAKTVLVALTGWGNPDDKERAFKSGFNFHLTKPIDNSALESVLAEV